MLPTASDRVLLVNPPVYDTRFPWARWQHPSTLLQLGTYAASIGSKTAMVDFLEDRFRSRLPRSRVSLLEIDDTLVPKWRYGTPEQKFTKALSTLTGWSPTIVYVECQTTFWWEGAAEAVRLCKSAFPDASVRLVGAYPQLAPQHARLHAGADELMTGPLPQALRQCEMDYSLYPTRPSTGYLKPPSEPGGIPALVQSIPVLAGLGIRDFAFSQNGVGDAVLFAEVLAALAAVRPRCHLHVLGNLSSRDLIAEPQLAPLMKAAGFDQIWFSDDRDRPVQASVDLEEIENCRAAASLLDAAGFKLRSDEVNGGLCIGRLGESLEERAESAALVAHHLGSVLLWQYQPGPTDFPDLALEDLNCKLFPLRRLNDVTYRDYLNVLSFGNILTSKYRDRTFDFSGHGLIASMLRDSFARTAWDAAPEVKGVGVRLPVMIR